ncbi:aldose 1-epimerase family protein [Chitinophaga qingshengii]|uniref:Aldose 1-epimerase family protein n=1 Tax=Chitinophaga qingshengii TaxID=1569794 RepID=A0ABR7TGU0_9BACT|nr:aldose 1-epimerase family protein [Chitinophaga qingshengii]MBC9929702.1 aldose 1-epimerase family protein [Chitinophaga qingshengii]
MVTLSNDQLTITLAAAGAELQHIVRRDNGLEYLWSGDPAVWGKKSPVLFPIVGGLKNNTYTYNGNSYTLGRHGFARERVFEVLSESATEVVFRLTDDDATMAVYPFRFDFRVHYVLEADTLKVTYHVQNTDEKTMLFSVGAHPAFKVPLADGTGYEDYYLDFNHTETAGRYPLSAGGQVELQPIPMLEHTQQLPLKKSLFLEDALVFKGLASDAISIRSNKTPHGLTVAFAGFPFMGIWAAKNADFVCIEPWCGIADNVAATGELADKEGINQLAPGALFERTWTATFF